MDHTRTNEALSKLARLLCCYLLILLDVPVLLSAAAAAASVLIDTDRSYQIPI